MKKRSVSSLPLLLIVFSLSLFESNVFGLTSIDSQVGIGARLSDSSDFWSFAQITDLHYDNSTSWRTRNLQNAIRLINNFKDDYNIKFVILTGDLVESPSSQSYSSLKHWLLANLLVPYKPIQGNH